MKNEVVKNAITILKEIFFDAKFNIAHLSLCFDSLSIQIYIILN